MNYLLVNAMYKLNLIFLIVNNYCFRFPIVSPIDLIAKTEQRASQ